MLSYKDIKLELKNKQYTWLVTGVAGFIGSNLLEELLSLNQKVVGIDNFSTGTRKNINEALLDAKYDENSDLFHFIEGDVSDKGLCIAAMQGIDFVLHQAALGSVPRSIKDPLSSSESNITGFLNILFASKESSVSQLVYASSSSVYGSNLDLPKKEDNVGEVLSPYALTKSINEQFAEVFAKTYNFQSIGLRYFNVFGKRQNVLGPYAAVIPKWITSLLDNQRVEIYGDGSTGRDFCYVKNAVQANLLAAMSNDKNAKGQVYNVALNDITSLNHLFLMIKEILSELKQETIQINPEYKEFRPGDIKSSQADISKIKKHLGYNPAYKIRAGLQETIKWYLDNHQKKK